MVFPMAGSEAGSDDWGGLSSTLPLKEGNLKGKGKGKHMLDGQGMQRPWLKVFETAPAQLLNAYGQAAYSRAGDQHVWSAMSQPLKTGALYMTEYASKDDERRGTAANRWLQVVLAFVVYQLREEVEKQNESIGEFPVHRA